MPALESIEAELIGIVQSATTVRRAITSADALYQDLWIMGDDAFELLERVSKRFGVSFAKLDFSSYFPDEAGALFNHLKAKLGWPDRKRRRLTVGHLASVVKRQEWFDPEE